MSKNVPYKIDEYDKKLLFELDKDSSVDLGYLAKKLMRSKPFIFYRMKRLEEEGIITSYTAIVDMSKLGYFTFRVYFKFQRMTIEDSKKVIEHVRKNLPQVWTITSMHGRWDLALFLGVRSIMEFHEIWDSIMLNYKGNIKSYNVAVYAPILNFNRKFFSESREESIVRVYGDGMREEVDDVDMKIIENYAPNVRQFPIEVGKKAGVSADTVRKRIRNLEKKKVIVGYKIGLNLENMGFVSYRVDLQLSSTHRNKELTEYCRQHRNIYQINKSIGGADFEMEVIVKDLDHLIKVVDELKTRFKGVINDVDYFGFSTFHVLKYIPD